MKSISFFKGILFVLMLSIIDSTSAQTVKNSVGIDRNPSTTLDVNGAVKFNGYLYLGGSDDEKGDIGDPTINSIVTSQGDNMAAKWTPFPLTYPKYGDYFLHKTISLNDNDGIQFTVNDSIGATRYFRDRVISAEPKGQWKEFENLRVQIESSEVTRKLVFQIEMIVSSDYVYSGVVNSSGLAYWNSFSIGLAVDSPDGSQKILKAVRSGVVYGRNYPEQLFYVLFTIEDLILNSPTGLNNVYIVGAYRASSPVLKDVTSIENNRANLYMGRSPRAPYSAELLRRASLRLDIYEKFR